jgi:hypothetical protein
VTSLGADAPPAPRPPPHPLTWQVLRALLAGRALSRNRHFALYQDPHAREARRLHRLLRSVARDLERAEGHIHLSPLGPEPVDGALLAAVLGTAPPEEGAGLLAWAHAEGGARLDLRLDLPRIRGHRSVTLAAWELALLRWAWPAAAARLPAATLALKPGAPPGA